MKIWRFLISLELCLLLLGLLCAIMGAGSFLLTGQYAAAINAMPLLVWLRAVPVGISWWLWLTLVLIFGIAINTLFCSSETIWSRWNRGNLIALLAPQLMHAGFLLIILAHLTSALWSSVDQLEVHEGSLATLPNGIKFGVAALSVTSSPQGMPVGFSSELVTNLDNPTVRTVISPNHPWLSGGYGVYIKQAEMYPFKRALFEIHREPGAGLALAGSLLFVVGNVLVLTLKSRNGREM
ncbi:MAG TPA: cytochrome C biogenesis protein ResB [Desulfuromonadales bacterium]|nr:cytochrome C biogenesis protein ResB [Desulfuromonadales bacterium]